jgi:septal ring factor EnvC (AmiA/AmiB activator)
MLNDKQQAMSIPGITGGTVVVLLQVISRLASNGGVNDAELSTVGTARDELVKALETATDVNFDTERAKQAQRVRELQAQARAQQAAAQKEAADKAAAEAQAEKGDATGPEVTTVSKGNGAAPVEDSAQMAAPANDEPVTSEATDPEGQTVS